MNLKVKETLAKVLTAIKKPLIIREVSVTVAYSGGNAFVTAPTVSGYTFLLWFAEKTDGWVGGVYNSLPTVQRGRVWTLPSNTGTGSGSVVCYALYIRSDLA